MIIKLANFTTDEYAQSLHGDDKSKWKSMKAGAGLLGAAAGAYNASELRNEFSPSAGRVKRFLISKGIRKPGLKDIVAKRHLTVGNGLRGAAVGAIGGALAGLATHEGLKYLKKKHDSR